MKRNLFLAILAFTLSACAPSMYVEEMKDQRTAMLFGYISASEGPMDFEWVQLRHTDAAGNEEYYTTRADEDGMFYAENLPLGQYQIHRMGKGVRPMGPNVAGGGGGVLWSLGEGSKATTMQVKKQGVRYFGSFQYTYIEPTSFFGRASFSFERAPKPPEKELLQRLVKYTKDTRWEAGVKSRLAELK